ncbi:septal ring lytic transglycosylase RlpA family protein [Dokdonella sp.]|uniref:septal ring lytic transglycosylase RlpA family protein n=1 Tax=Dokdonella sp. TaxID=2291710 RepID=UPI001B0922E0|nr:septal ring lytic transglycosylase RlpA family protein [Dokdonella sp.]MBO9662219.1 septal ring lytic transglycosylase RlpA family protein [Dokdonella sp.]
MSASRALLLAALGLALAACSGPKPRRDAPRTPPSSPRGDRLPAETSRQQSERYHKDQDGGPDAPAIDVSKIPEPVPKAEPRSRYGNRETYSVLGRSYRVLPDARGYSERGVASWYGNKFHGYMTSSFEPYDMYAFSAAHKTLPLPSYARVTNLENGKSVVVRVNDRGPFHENRLIDLSYAAAVKIGVWPKGTGLVEVRAIDPERPDALPPTQVASIAPSRPIVPARADEPPPSAGGAPRIYLQIGAFGDRANAERAVANATRAGLDRVDIQSATVDGRTVHRVRVGPLPDVDAADAMTERIEQLGLGAPRVAIER